MTHHPIPVGRGVLQRPRALSECEVGAKDASDHRVVDHHAAPEVGAVALGAGVQRFDEVLAARGGELSKTDYGQYLLKLLKR